MAGRGELLADGGKEAVEWIRELPYPVRLLLVAHERQVGMIAPITGPIQVAGPIQVVRQDLIQTAICRGYRITTAPNLKSSIHRI
jgi:hypothetical protein